MMIPNIWPDVCAGCGSDVGRKLGYVDNDGRTIHVCVLFIPSGVGIAPPNDACFHTYFQLQAAVRALQDQREMEATPCC